MVGTLSAIGLEKCLSEFSVLRSQDISAVWFKNLFAMMGLISLAEYLQQFQSSRFNLSWLIIIKQLFNSGY